MYMNILIPLDGSVLAEQALHQIGHVAAPGAQVTLIQVVHSPTPIVAPEMAVPLPTGGLEEVRDEVMAYLRSEAEGVSEGQVQVSIDAIEGDDVASTIVGYAKDHGCDLIVISTHGRGGLSRLVFGSVAENVVRHAPCPVLVMRPSS